MRTDTVTLWWPVGPAELELIRAAGMRAFPPRLPEQPIFYPVLSEDYAIRIARDWNVPVSGTGYVTRFEVRRACLNRYQPQAAGGAALREYWIPAEDLGAFNEAIVGEIVVTEYSRERLRKGAAISAKQPSSDAHQSGQWCCDGHGCRGDRNALVAPRGRRLSTLQTPIKTTLADPLRSATLAAAYRFFDLRAA